MKELKFWAIPFSGQRLLLYVAPIFIILILVAINIDTLQYFLYLCSGVMLAIIVALFLFVKRVQLTLDETKIGIKINGGKEDIKNIEDLQFVRGANINLPKSQGDIHLSFNNELFVFSIFDMRRIGDTAMSKHCDILNALITIYALEDREKDKRGLSKMHTYWNPKYRKSAT